jgi:dGTPase
MTEPCDLSPIRQWTQELELKTLSAFGFPSIKSQGRARPEPQDPVRTPFQVDRDRILHSKAFRRLKHKTQVFIDPQGDHIRTRLTHTLEVSQIARTIGRALRLNEDLIEAIALGHDVGHTPFGHAGEDALDQCIQEFRQRNGLTEKSGAVTRFRHYEQSLRIVDVIENLNLCEETRMGISGHSKGRNDLTSADGVATSTLEAAVVRISDRIAYINHDFDDALRFGVIDRFPDEYLEIAQTHGRRIGAMVEDVIRHSVGQGRIELSASMRERLNFLKEWLFENVYLKSPEVIPEIEKSRRMIRVLFDHHTNVTDGSPEDRLQTVVDYISGMTDRYAIAEYQQLQLD